VVLRRHQPRQAFHDYAQGYLVYANRREHVVL